ncbi:hypothetical protein BKA62DRAFT_758269 [Auriculariales sp. MPI-PUGE-AT-0066]|nr:hypothetical protein BKA62DRAFT_758269 [Auriculariales sp. MPI-PUGE-AT-0066]
MIHISGLLYFSFLATIVVARDVPVFTLNCADYPDVCNTHCYAIACSGSTNPNFRDVNRYLHYAPNADTSLPNTPATKVDEATYRRQAIGCATSGCADNTAKQCDEFPYASTYDGGLGCVIDRFKGQASEIARTGVYHCADKDDNRKHGTALKAFYGSASLGNGGRFQIGFDEANIDRAAGCARVRDGGSGVCSDFRKLSTFSVRTQVPGPTTYCPRQQRRRRALSDTDDEPIDQGESVVEEAGQLVPDWDGHVNVTFHRVADAHGRNIVFPFTSGAPASGTEVYHVRDDGSVHISTLV